MDHTFGTWGLNSTARWIASSATSSAWLYPFFVVFPPLNL